MFYARTEVESFAPSSKQATEDLILRLLNEIVLIDKKHNTDLGES